MSNKNKIFQLLPEIYPRLIQLVGGKFYDGNGNIIDISSYFTFSGGTSSTGITGPQGPQGFQGPAGIGVQGPQGPMGSGGGITGPQGPQGVQGPPGGGSGSGMIGPTGPQGPQGFQGPTGPQGFQGSDGSQGLQGPTGPQGFQGSDGSQGLQGPTGPQGFQGLDGLQGLQGPTGPQGFQGLDGLQGLQGSTGPQGFQGSDGPQGFQGPIGPQGFQGSTGPQGFQGPIGPQGFQGSTGPQGFQGPQGSSSVSGYLDKVNNFDFFTHFDTGTFRSTGSGNFINSNGGWGILNTDSTNILFPASISDVVQSRAPGYFQKAISASGSNVQIIRGGQGSGFYSPIHKMSFGTYSQVCAMYMPILSDATQTYVWRFGVRTSTTATNLNNSAYIEMSLSSGTPRWSLVTAGATLSTTSTNTSINIVANTHYKVELIVVSGSIRGLIDNVDIVSGGNTTNLPDYSLGYWPFYQLSKTFGTGGRTIFVDWHYENQTLSNPYT